jgi:hypothetical protein
VDAALTALLRADLLAAGYTVDRLRQLWGDESDAALARGDRVPARRALAQRAGGGRAGGMDHTDAASILARVFLLGEAVPADERQLALPSLGVAGAR